MTSNKKSVAEKQDAALSPVLSFLEAEDVGSGLEGTDKDSFAIPFLRILQKLSPACDEAKAEFMEGAKAGMLMNSVSNMLYDGKQGVTFLPCYYQRRFIQWGPRGSDRGYSGEFLPEDVKAMQQEGKVIELEGKLLVADEKGGVSEKKSDVMTDTRSHFGIVIDEKGGVSQALFTLSSTQIKKSKQLMTLLDNAQLKTADGYVKPPTWVNKIRLTTVLESNDQGSWHGIKIEAEGFIEDANLYAAGKAFHAAIAAGEAKANFAEVKGEQESDTPSDKF